MGTDTLGLSAQVFTAFLLTFSRVIGMFSAMPLIGERMVPWQVKVGLSVAVALLLMPAAHAHLPLPADNWTYLFVCVLKELLVGISLGYLARLVFGAFYFSVNLLDFQSGLSFAEVVNPGADSNLAVMGQFLNTLMLILFFEFNGPHVLLRALAVTIQAVPLGGANLPLGGATLVAQLFATLVVFGLQLALPAVLVLLLIDIAFGLIGRVVPQLNVFLVALPVKIMVVLLTISLCLPILAPMMGKMLNSLSEALNALTRMMA